MDRVRLTENELLEALESALGNPATTDDAYTTADLMDMTHKGRAWLQIRLHAAVKAGVAEPVIVQRPDNWGVVHARPGYRFRQAA